MAAGRHHYFNRELSWLEFNQRVLEEGKDADNPLLERLKFIAISASNLDEFFMIRVGGLHMARKAGRRKKDISGRTPLMQLREISTRTRAMLKDLHGCYTGIVSPALAKAGIVHLDIAALDSRQEAALSERFREEILPVITPIAIKPDGQRILLENLALHLLVRLESPRRRRRPRNPRYAVMSLARSAPRLLPLPADQGYAFVLLEEVLKKYAGDWFPDRAVADSTVFRVTRNADFAVAEREAPDLLTGMEEILEDRKRGDCVRLEIEQGTAPDMLALLLAQIPAEKEQVFPVNGPLDLKDFMGLSSIEGFDELKAEAWPPQPPADIVPNEPMFKQIAENDRLFYHPYESFDSVVRFIEEAAADDEVLAIKMVLYRTGSEGAIIKALERAAENGINVTVLLELKARFDEARNMERARELEQRGVQVIHGVKGYKTHAKVCLVVRRESQRVVRYCHFGTGNYNESTAKLYGDISYMTCNQEMGEDISAFFNALCGYAQPSHFNAISMAPVNMRERLIELIEFETARAEKGKKARIAVKVNALVDIAISEKLYTAAKAGVKIDLNVRGICCLAPTYSITVTSVVDRYLEHARIIHFHHGGQPLVFISSADWMPRNLDKRLEIMAPVVDPPCRSRLIRILDLHIADNQNAWRLRSDGTYQRIAPRKGGRRLRSQAALHQMALEAATAVHKTRRTRFQPHRRGAEVQPPVLSLKKGETP